MFTKQHILYSSLAQLAEHLTVNQVVAGSSPAGGAKKKALAKASAFFYPIRRIGMKSRVSEYVIAVGVWHHAQHVSPFGLITYITS